MGRTKTPNKARRRYLRALDSRVRMQQRPGLVEGAQAFAPIYSLLREMRTGEASAVQGRVVLQDYQRAWCEAAAALEGWAGCWERVVEGEHLNIDLAPLWQLQRYLDNGILIPPELLDKVWALTNACYQAFKGLPRKRMHEYSQAECIAREFQRLGVCGDPHQEEQAV